MPRIQANRDAIDDRFSVLGFTVRSESPLFEVGVATDPALFRVDNKAARNRRNFFSSRSSGVLRARRGEAVYLVPPDVLSNFIGQPKLYFGLATYRENSKGAPDYVQAPGAGTMYVSLSGLTERGLRRLTSSALVSSYGHVNGRDPSLEWGGDAWPQPASTGTAAAPTGAATSSTNANPPAPYDDGFGVFPDAAAHAGNGATPATPPTAATPAATAQALRRVATPYARVLTDDSDLRGIEGPIPDAPDDAPAAPAAAQTLDAPAPEYPQASRFVPAAAKNYRAMSSARTIDKVVLHITDGGANINGTIAWFRNPQAQVSAHYVIGRDGEVVQMVRHNDKAWHASSANTASIGIEHVANTRGLIPTGVQLCASAALVAWLCDQFGIPPDREHILGHSEADPRTSHTGCPNAVWNWDHYMQMIDTRSCIEPAAAIAQSLGARRQRAVARAQPALARAQEIITPFYDPANPASALTCQNDAFSQAREEWFVGVPNTRMFPHSAIVKLTMAAPNGDMYGGTGFYIGRDRILTCAHNLHGMSRVTIAPGSNAAGDTPFGSATVQSSGWRIAPGYSGDGDWPHDLAVIDTAPIAAPNGRWFDFLNATPSDRMPIVVCGYSAQSDAVPELTQAIDGEKQHLHGGYASEQTDLETIQYTILTLKGASGSPVYHLSEGRDGALQALVTAVHVTGEPAARGLNGGCFMTPQKIDWIERRTTTLSLRSGARTLAATTRALAATSVHWDEVPSYPQTSPMSCWAASAAMVVGWRDRMSIADAEIARMVPVIDAYRAGLWPRDRQQLADAWNLVAEPPASYTIDSWVQMLQTYGPLYVDMTWSGPEGGHVRVLVGMETDGNPDGSGTTMYMHDPWPETPGRIKLPFADFLALYENRTGNSGGQLLYQILHADRIPEGVQPATAVPFALTLASEAELAATEPPSTKTAYAGGDLNAPASPKNGNAQPARADHLPPPPAPIVQQQALRARPRSLAAEIVEVESPIPGTRLRRVRDNDDGVVSWDLDQLDGMKHPESAAPSIAATPRDGEPLILAEWPYLEGDDGQRICMDLEVLWQFDGSAVGNIRTSRRGAAASEGHRLAVTARVADVAGSFPSDNPVCAAIDVNVEYRFTRPDGSVVVAVYALRLFGNGRHNCAGRWLDA